MLKHKQTLPEHFQICSQKWRLQTSKLSEYHYDIICWLEKHVILGFWVNWRKMTIFCTWKRFQYRKHINNKNHFNHLPGRKVLHFVTTGSKSIASNEPEIAEIFRVKRNVSSISTGHLSEVFEKGKPPKSVSLPRKVIFTEEDMKQLSPQTSLGHSTGQEL